MVWVSCVQKLIKKYANVSTCIKRRLEFALSDATDEVSGSIFKDKLYLYTVEQITLNQREQKEIV